MRAIKPTHGKQVETKVLSDRIRFLRIQRQETLPEAARAIGVAAGYLSQLEQNTRGNPTVSVLYRISQHYQQPMDFFVGVESPRQLEVDVALCESIQATHIVDLLRLRSHVGWPLNDIREGVRSGLLPRPFAHLNGGPVWLASDILRWLEDHQPCRTETAHFTKHSRFSIRIIPRKSRQRFRRMMFHPENLD